MTQFSETATPNGGWQFLQPQTGWALNRQSKPTSISVTLDQAAELLQRHRESNPQFNLATGFYEIRQEILDYNRKRLGIPPPDSPKRQPAQPKGAAVVAGQHARKTVAGIRLVVDWLGEGLIPVEPHISERRAQVCVTCPMNQAGDFWQRMDAVAAEGVRKLIGVKRDMQLKTSVDEKLKSCIACDCFLPLKVHAPIEHILRNTSDEVMRMLDPRCWIPKEKPA